MLFFSLYIPYVSCIFGSPPQEPATELESEYHGPSHVDAWEASSEENPVNRSPVDMPSPSPSEAPSGDEGENPEGQGEIAEQVEGEKGAGTAGEEKEKECGEAVEEIPDTLALEIPDTQRDESEEPPTPMLQDGQGWWNVDKSPSPNNILNRPPASATVDPTQVDTLPYDPEVNAVVPTTGREPFAPVDMSAIDERIAFLQCLSTKLIVSVYDILVLLCLISTLIRSLWPYHLLPSIKNSFSEASIGSYCGVCIYELACP